MWFLLLLAVPAGYAYRNHAAIMAGNSPAGTIGGTSTAPLGQGPPTGSTATPPPPPTDSSGSDLSAFQARNRAIADARHAAAGAGSPLPPATTGYPL